MSSRRGSVHKILKNKGKCFSELDNIKLLNKKSTEHMLVPIGCPGSLVHIYNDLQQVSIQPFCFYTYFKKDKGQNLQKNQLLLNYSTDGWKNAYDEDVEQVNIRGMSGCPIIECDIIREPILLYNFSIIAFGVEWDEEAYSIKGICAGSVFRSFINKFAYLKEAVDEGLKFRLRNSL